MRAGLMAAHWAVKKAGHSAELWAVLRGALMAAQTAA
jgi:hypothetical protein